MCYFFANDTTLVADSSEKLQLLLSELESVYEKRNLRVKARFSTAKGQVTWGCEFVWKKFGVSEMF